MTQADSVFREIVYQGRTIRVSVMNNHPDYPTYWRLLRVGVLMRDHFECQTCGAIFGLEVSHTNGDKTDCRPCNMRTLCGTCHRKYDRKSERDRGEDYAQSAAYSQRGKRAWETRRAKYGGNGASPATLEAMKRARVARHAPK